MIEPPVFILRLEADLRARNVSFVQRNFSSSDEILWSLTRNIIVNCTGLGAMTLWNDGMMLPIKGQLAMLPPQPMLQYLFSRDGYMFPRTDHVVIGGTFEKCVNDETPDPSVCQGLVRNIMSVFGEAPAEALASIHVDHPGNVWAVNPPLPRRVRRPSPPRERVNRAVP